jgi:hypothetical protein
MAALPILEAPAGIDVTTAGVTVYTNATGSGRRKIVRVSFVNIDGVNDAALSYCRFVDAAPAGSFAILPVNAKVAKLDGLYVTKTLDPGDSITAAASANGDIEATVEIVGSEAV